MRVKLALASLIMLYPLHAAGQVSELWVARYHGPVPGSGDVARAIAFDGITGNLYVTGASQGMGTGLDYATVAYDSCGNQLWEARYNGPGNGDDIPNGMAVDSSTGNIYVTGQSPGVGTGLDYATVAYDSSGNQLWEARYNGPANADDSAVAIALDGGGNVYVTGTSADISGTNSATVAYDASGNQLWVARFSRLGTTSTAAAIAVDSTLGNVYIAGVHKLRPPDHFIATDAYDFAGNPLWSRESIFASDAVHASGVALGSNGNIYVAGFKPTSAGTELYETIAHNPNGDLLWFREYHLGFLANMASGIAVDRSKDQVYVTGTVMGSATFGTVAYDSNGNQLWDKTFGGGTQVPFPPVNSIVVDIISGNVYVTGPNKGTVGNEYATVAYDSTGNQLWAIRYHGPGSGDDVSRAIAADSQTGTVYVTGSSQAAGGGSDFATVAYSQ